MTERHCHECGAVQMEEPKHNRSTPQLRRFYAIIRAAYLNWPEQPPSGFRPQNEEHLRRWLEMRAGLFTVTKQARITSTDPDKLYALMSEFFKHSKDTTLFNELDGNLLIQKQVKSIAYEAIKESAEFSRLKDAICEIIEIEVGVAAEKLLRESEKAA